MSREHIQRENPQDHQHLKKKNGKTRVLKINKQLKKLKRLKKQKRQYIPKAKDKKVS